jgi:5-methylthioadenosine/S-adenosylhomocysteine deaminase
MRRPVLTIVILAIMILAPWSLSTSSFDDDEPNMANGRSGGIEISELFVSPNQLKSNTTSGNMNIYNATDWNGDGDYGAYSDQFIEIWNNGSATVDVSDWILSTTSGSPPCQIAWNTNISADGRIVVFRADSDLALNFHSGETVTISSEMDAEVHSLSFPEKDSDYGKSYVKDSNNNLVQVTPTPGWGPNDTGTYTVAQNIVKCYKVFNADSSRAFLLQGRVVTMESETGVINQGNVMIRDGKITGVWSSADQPPAGVDFTNVPIVKTNGTIYPGLIDLHNHMHYNHIPLWDFNVHLNANQRSEEGGYNNRYQWGDNYDYGPSITWMKNNVQDRDRWDMASEQMKYAEVQLVAGGVTAVQGSPSSGTQAWDSILARNVELYNFGQDNVQTCAVCSWNENSYNSQGKLNDMADGDLEAWFIHLSEGVDSSSKQEFDDLFEKGLVKEQTMVIHGTGLDRSQFDKMASVNADLIWSPLSNLLLYGDTTDVVEADTAGVRISIAPDWGPSGSKSNLHELKTADLWNTEVLNNHFTNYELAQMVTSNPAAATGWSNFVGQVKSDLYADLVVLDTFHEDPYRNLIEAVDADVRLTVIQGKAVFGDVDIMQELQGNDWEYLNGTDFQKAIDITSTTEIDGTQTFQEIESGLAMAMRNEFEDIKANWVDVAGMTDTEINAWLGTSFDGDYRDETNHLKSLTLDPIFTTGDDRYFDVINRSTHANFHVDLSKLYDNYYDVEMINGDRVDVSVQLPTDTTDTNSNNNTNTNTNNGGNQNTNTGGGDTTVLPGPTNETENAGNTDGTQIPEAPPDDDYNDGAASGDDTARQLKLILLIIVVAMMFGLFIISKSGGDELLESGEALIEKMWDEENPEPMAEENFNDSSSSTTEDTSSNETNPMKEKVANAMKTSGLSAVRMFMAIDQTSDGFVSRRELRTAINGLLKDNVKMKDIDSMISTFDKNGDGVISMDEFLDEMEENQTDAFVPKLPDLAPPPSKKKKN